MARPKSMVLFGTLMCGMFYSKMAQVYRILRRCTYIIRMGQKNYQSVYPSPSLFNQWFGLRGPRRLGGVDISPTPCRKRVDEEVAVGVVIKILLFIL